MPYVSCLSKECTRLTILGSQKKIVIQIRLVRLVRVPVRTAYCITCQVSYSHYLQMCTLTFHVQLLDAYQPTEWFGVSTIICLLLLKVLTHLSPCLSAQITCSDTCSWNYTISCLTNTYFKVLTLCVPHPYL